VLFSRTFYRNAINSGLPIMECPELYATVHEGDEIDIDLSGSIQHQGRSIPFPTFPDSVRELLERGGLAEYLKARQQKTPNIMKLLLDYGSNGLDVEFPEARTRVIEPLYVPATSDPVRTLRNAIQNPIGKPPLRELYKPGKRVGISVCDITRAQPRQVMVEALLAEMPDVRMQDVTVFIATGTHRKNTDAEIEAMLGKDIHGNADSCATTRATARRWCLQGKPEPVFRYG
jgi:hypothetical protein